MQVKYLVHILENHSMLSLPKEHLLFSLSLTKKKADGKFRTIEVTLVHVC